MDTRKLIANPVLETSLTSEFESVEQKDLKYQSKTPSFPQREKKLFIREIGQEFVQPYVKVYLKPSHAVSSSAWAREGRWMVYGDGNILFYVHLVQRQQR
jgi:hypothetical protein